MAQRPALSTTAVEVAEELFDTWRTRAADGVICADDMAHLEPQIVLVLVSTQCVDVAQAAGLAVMRGGADAQRAKGLMREVQAFMPGGPDAA